MSEGFDPYYEWMGIPPREQPPHHYRLLAITAFEENLTVIQNAADQRMSHLRTFQTGKHVAESQRLLNEVSAARICLLNPVQKAAYDGRLRQRLTPRPVALAPPVVPAPLPVDVGAKSPAMDSEIRELFAEIEHSVHPSSSEAKKSPRPCAGEEVRAQPLLFWHRLQTVVPPRFRTSAWLAVAAVAVLLLGGTAVSLLIVRLHDKQDDGVVEKGLPEGGSTLAGAKGGKKAEAADTKPPGAPTSLSPPRVSGIQSDKSSKSADVPASYAHEREVAQWALSAGGRLDVETADGSLQRDVQSLPSGPFWVSSLGLGKPEILDRDLERLRGLQRLKGISLGGAKTSDETLKVISELPSLEGVSLWWRAYTDDGLQHLGRLKKLKVLGLEGTQLTDAALASFSDLEDAEFLQFGRTFVKGPGLVHLAKMNHVNHLWLYDTPIDDGGLTFLPELKSLTAVSLDETKVSDAGLKELRRLPALRELHLARTQVTGSGLAHLDVLSSLERLDLAGTKLDDAGLANLPALPTLQWLNISETGTGDAGIEHLRNLAAIRELRVEKTKVTAQCLVKLHQGLPECKFAADEAVMKEFDEWIKRESEGEKAPGTVAQRPAEPPKPGKRLAVPDEEAQSQAMKGIRGALALLGGKNAHNEAARALVVDQLLQQAYDPATPPATRYVAYDQACRNAVKAGNGALAMDTIERMGQLFDVDSVEMKLETLQEAIKIRLLPAQRASLAVDASNLVDDALAANQPKQAQLAVSIAMAQAKVAKSAEIARQVRVQTRMVEQVVKSQGEFEAAKAALADHPDDAQANLTAGRYQCFVLDNWPVGLPMLAKGSDEALKKLAVQDQAGAAGPESQVALADAWAKIALDASAVEREHVRSRAMAWYRLAQPTLRGLQKEKADRYLGSGEMPRRRPPRRLVNEKDGSVLVLIPAGEFLAGEQRFKVQLPAYYLGLTTVTNAQYKKFMEQTGGGPPGNNWTGWPDRKERPNPAWDGHDFRPGFADHPVTCVTGDEADAYCRWADLRLPSELEWEKGARGIDGRPYPWGDQWDPGRCFNKTIRGDKITCPVLTFPAGRSPWGLYNMSGNVWQWCAERNDGKAYERYARGDLTPATEGLGLWRGGSSDDDDKGLVCTVRAGNVRGCGYANLGFRVAKTVGP